MSNVLNILAFGWPGAPELIVIAVVGVLVFGNRLPEVGKSLGKGIVEFKKGLKGLKDEIDEAGDSDKQHSTENT